uniref:Uncharacterized protein n=1 Tax=Geobacillus sp. (strain WCH70) TaxID=471223 RepID=C5DAI2_GEOSW
MPNKELTVACQQRKVRSVCLQTFLLLFIAQQLEV